MSEPSAGRVRRARAGVTIVFLINGISIGLWGGHVAWLGDRHDLDHVQLSAALLAFAAGAVLAMSIAGWLTARFGSRRCLQVAGPAFCLLLMTPYVMTGFVGVIAVTVVMGAANGVTDVAMNVHGSVVERLRRQPIMSSFHAFFSLGVVLGAGIAAATLGAGLTPERAMPVVAVALAASIAVGLAGLLCEAGDEGGGAGLIRPSRPALQIGALTFLAMAGEGAVLDWIGVYLAQILRAPLSAAALGVSVFALAMAAGRLGGDRLVRRLGDRTVLRASAATAAVGLAAVLAAPTPGMAMAAIVVVGLGIANIVPILFAAATRLPGIAPGQGLATVAMIGYAGFLVAPPSIGAVADAFGLDVAMWLIVAAVVVVSAMAHRIGAGRLAERRA